MGARFTPITFTVKDFQRSIDFYRDVCGIDVVRDRRLEGGTSVWLGPATPPDSLPPYVFVLVEGPVENRLDHLAFQCDSRDEVDEKAALGRRLGVLAQDRQDDGGSVAYHCKLSDPDGHLVEFTHGQPIAGI